MYTATDWFSWHDVWGDHNVASNMPYQLHFGLHWIKFYIFLLAKNALVIWHVLFPSAACFPCIIGFIDG